MPDLATFSTVLNSLKVAADIAKTLKDSDLSIERAEMKMKVAELMSALADAKISTLELQDTVREKEAEISRLSDALTLKAQVVKDGDAYFMLSDGGEPEGEPFCIRCWESKKLLFHLVKGVPPNKSMCPTCKTSYDWYSIPQHNKKKG